MATPAGGRVADAPLEAYERLEPFRSELTGYCYRMLGSVFDAEDAVQDTMVRAWKGLDRFEGRAQLRSWLYRIATNVCLDVLNGRKRRAMPMDMSPEASPPVMASLGEPKPPGTWVEPAPDGAVLPEVSDPADVAVARESVRLAFVTALQNLPPRQRAVLILRDVLRWKADEVATLLDASTASVNSALQRARATLATRDLGEATATTLSDEARDLADRYVTAFEAYDIDALVSLLHEDATQCMPPFALWLQGPQDIAAWHLGPGAECRGSRMVPTSANGMPAFGQYRPSGPGGRHEPWALQVLDVRGGRIHRLHAFLDTRLFGVFGLPEHPDDV
ncbi:sigma-70 family RNA polymerase sigma factor [Thalassiella azotivora]